jgi:PPM family protein phosphatase
MNRKQFVTIGSATHPGMKKKENQDFHSWRFPENGNLNKKGILLVLADGMGGHLGGSVASRLAVDTAIAEYYKDASGIIQESLKSAFLKANETVLEKSRSDLGLQGMGTTLIAVVLQKDNLYFAHVGDSRGYAIYGNRITQFTRDHSIVAGLVKAGLITKEEALNHPDSNIITKAIGLFQDLSVDISEKHMQLNKGEYVLMCCDGLYKVVSDEEIVRTIIECREPDAVCGKLIEKANERGGPDNITVIVARIEKPGILSGIKSGFQNLIK